jgi:hypothetical protein
MHIERNPTEARQGQKTGVVRWILLTSLGGAVILLAVIYVWFMTGTSVA